MANSQTFSIKLTANGKEVKELMDALKKQADDYEKDLAAINERLKERDKLTKEEIKTLEQQSNSLAAKIKGLNTAVEENITNLRKVDDVMKNLAGSSGAELGKALRGIGQQFKRVSDETLKSGETMEQKLTEIKEKMIEVRHEMTKRDGIDAMKRAKATMDDLVNTPLDKLKMGLDSIEKKLSTMSEAERQAAEGLELLEAKSRYQAQMFVTENGRAGVSSISGMDNDQLRAEQQRLRQGYMTTDGVKGYETISQEYLTRLQNVNQLIKDRAEAEREALRVTKEAEQAEQQRLEFAQQGQQTHKTLADMEKASYEDLENALKHLQEQYKQYASGDTKHIQRNLANQDKLKRKMQEIQKMILSDKQISDRVNNSKKYSVVQLQQAYDQLKVKLSNLRIEEVDAIKTTQKQMQALQNEIDKAQGKVTGLTKVWKTAVRNIGTYMGVFALAGFVKNKLSEVINKNYELSDSIMNVRKVSGLAVDEVQKLYEEISKIDTRNTINTLMDLAYQGGKLGIGNYGVEGLAGFVKAAEQVQMALGEEMGEDALPAMAKLTENMDLIRKYGVEEAMQKTASAIFQLYTSSVSTGTGIVDFAKRLMPVAKSAGVTTDELLGLASATESSGLEAEKASTAFAKMFPSIYKNADAIEKFLNIDPGTIRTMYDQNQAMQAMVLVFDKMQDLGNLNKYPEIFKLLGSEGARMTSVMTAMANNVDMLRTHLQTSTEAFIEGTAVINEYNLQNASAAAVLERANNVWEKAFVNPEGVDMVKDLAQEWYNLSKSLTESETYMSGVKGTLSAIATVVGVLIKILPTLLRALMFYGAAQAIRKIWIEFSALNVSINSATTGMARLNAIMKSNVWVLGATAIAFAVTYLYDMAAAAEKASEKLGALEEAEKEAKEESVRQRVELKKLYDVTQDQTKSIDERKEALRKMVGDENYKEYYEKLANEENLANLAANAYRDLTDEIIKTARARAYANKITELETERIKKEDEKAEKEEWKKNNQEAYEKGKKEYENQQKFAKDVTKSMSGAEETQIARRGAAAMKPKIIEQYESTERSITELDSSIDKLGKDMDNLKNKINELNIQPKSGSGGGGGGGNEGGEGDTVPKELVEAKKEAEKQATAVISTIEEYYRLQEAAANELAAEGKINKSELEMLIQHINDRKDSVLLEARRAIVSDENNFDEIRKTLHQDLVKRDDKVSLRAIESIQRVDIAKAAEIINRFDGSKEVYGLDSRAFKNNIRKNAAQNELNIQRRQAKMQEEIDKILIQYEYVEQAQKTFGDKLVKLGLITDGYDKVVQQLADGTEIVANTKDVQALASKVVKMDAQRMYGVDPDDALELRNMIDALMHTVDKDGKKIRESFASMFPNLNEWMKNPERYKEQMQAFYKTLIDMDSDYYKALKQNYEKEQREFNERWQSMGWTSQQERENTAFDTRDSLRKISGQGLTFGQTYGFSDTIADDPEIARIKNRMEWRARELEDLQARNASEELIMAKQNEMMKEAASLAEKVSQEVAERISKVQTLSEPLNAFGEEVGQKLGEIWQGISQDGKLSFGQMARNMGIEYAKLTLKMATENLMKQVQQALFYKQMEAQALAHETTLNAIQASGDAARIGAKEATGAALAGIQASQNATEIAAEGGKATVMTAFGISSGAAKTIARLGWWGIPLIGVISSILMGLLNSAKATAGQESNSSSSTKDAQKLKLVSGMLTYDAGNLDRFAGRRKVYDDGTTQVYGSAPVPAASAVGHYLGTDGHVYRATPVSADSVSGVSLIRKPIATTVQGNPALVAERGPEIVIGRRATANIMRWNPALLNVLASYDPHSRRRPYDEGTPVPAAAPVPDASASGSPSDPRLDATLASLAQTVALLSATVSDLQKNGIPAKIDKYGPGGLIDEVKSGLKFDAKYGH